MMQNNLNIAEDLKNKDEKLLMKSEDPFYSIENMDELERRINSVCAGESTLKEHELIEVD